MKTQNKRKFSRHDNTISSLRMIMPILSLVLALVAFFEVTQKPMTAYAANSYDFEVTSATTDFYVNDFANLFTQEQKKAMMQKAIQLDQQNGGIQVVVTTVSSLKDCAVDGKDHSIEEVGYAMYNQYGIGQDDMGILILFSSGDREVSIETGKQMQAYITDSKSGQLLDDYGMDYFVNDHFAEGLVSVQNAVISEINSVVPQDWNAPASDKKMENDDKPATDKVGATNVAKDNKTDSSTKGAGGIVAAFLAVLAGLVASIKGLFSSKKKAAKQKEETEKAQKEQKDAFEKRIASLKEANLASERQKDKECERRIRRKQETFDAKISDLQRTIEAKDKSISDAEGTISSLTKELRQANAELGAIQNKYSRIQALHPDVDFEKEIREMIESEFKATAAEVDKAIAHCADQPADKDNVEVFSNALLTYRTQVPEVQKYVRTDYEKIHSLYEQSVSLKREFERAEQEKRDRAAAQKAFDRIKLMCSGISSGTHETYQTLENAYNVYNRLSTAEKKYFPDNSLLQRVNSLLRDAKEDDKNFNAAREAENDIHRIVDRIYSADEGDRDNLERAFRYYRNLSIAQQAYFSSELLRKVKRLIDDAESDHRRKEDARRRKKEKEEEEARRRRQRMMSSSSSFSSSSHHSHSSFGGHGGRASGGGASRHF